MYEPMLLDPLVRRRQEFLRQEMAACRRRRSPDTAHVRWRARIGWRLVGAGLRLVLEERPPLAPSMGNGP